MVQHPLYGKVGEYTCFALGQTRRQAIAIIYPPGERVKAEIPGPGEIKFALRSGLAVLPARHYNRGTSERKDVFP